MGGAQIVIGVGGKYCAGKSSVAAFFAAQGWLIINVDAIGHQQLEEQAVEIAQSFNENIKNPDGSINRQQLGRLVFSDPRARHRLEKILHPPMRQRVKEQIAHHDRYHNHIVIDAALLLQMQLYRFCDHILWVKALLPLRIIRALRRDALSLIQIWQRERAQRHLVAQISVIDADIHIVGNNGGITALHRNLERWLAAQER